MKENNKKKLRCKAMYVVRTILSVTCSFALWFFRTLTLRLAIVCLILLVVLNTVMYISECRLKTSEEVKTK